MYEIIIMNGKKHIIRDHVDVTEKIKAKTETQLDRLECYLELLLQLHGVEW